MARKLFSTILEEIKNAHEDDKSIVLQTNDSPMLRTLLQAALEPSIKFDTPIPEYRENTETDGYASNNLYVEQRRLYIFMDSYVAVSKERKSVLLAQILESIDPSDALALIKVINKDFDEFGLTREIVNEAFPGLLK
jgi:hypothetical protein